MLSLLLSLFSVAVAAPGGGAEKCKGEKPRGSFEASVSALSDGDTIEVRMTNQKVRRIRFLFVDTPETHFQGQSQGKPGELAADHLKELIPIGTAVRIQFSDSACDQYGRYLGKVMKGNMDVNAQMVQDGYASSLCFAPNISECAHYAELARKSFESGEQNVFRDLDAQVPHEFRYEKAKKPEAEFVGSAKTKKVFPYEKFREIDPWDRIFFPTAADLIEPFEQAD